MDKKTILLMLVSLVLLAGLANAQSANPLWKDVGYDQSELNYDIYPTSAFGFRLFEDVQTSINLRVYNDLYLADKSVYVKFITYPNNTAPGTNTYVEIRCLDTVGTLNLSDMDNWIGNGWGIHSFRLIEGSLNQSIRTDNNERASILASTACNLTARGQDLYATFYFFQEATGDFTCPDCSVYSIPNQALADLVDRTGTTVTAVFDIMDITLMMIAFVLVVFFIVFLYKLFIYFASRRSG